MMILMSTISSACEIEDCEYPRLARSLCKNHYQRLRRTGDVGSGYIKSSAEYLKVCTIESCEKKCRGLGYCNSHYLKLRRYGNPTFVSPNRGFRGHHSEETKKKMSITRKGQLAGDKHPMWGKQHSEDTRQKMSEAKLGKKLGPQPQKYVDDPKYMAIHNWMRRHYPKTGICEACEEERLTYWSNVSGDYRRQRDDFWELCVPCHKLFDYLLAIEKANPGTVAKLKARRLEPTVQEV